VTVFQDGQSYKAIAAARKPLPNVLCLDSNTEETLEFLDSIWDEVLDRAMVARARKASARKPSRPISSGIPRIGKYFDFTTLDFITPSAALILASLFQRSKFITGNKLQTIDEHKWSPIVAGVLTSIGFHDLLEMPSRSKVKLDFGDLRLKKFVSGERADPDKPGALQEALTELLPEEMREKLLDAEPYGGMLEAILNSHSWAYPDDASFRYPVLPRWWLTGAVDVKTNTVIVCVYDQGVSIPVSLPRWTSWNTFELRGKKLIERLKLSRPIDHYSNDGLAIELAMKISRSNTNLPQHGKGLHTMVEVAQRARHGSLRIMSRNGEYVWETGKRPRSMTHEHPLRGTLVEWQLQL
jgi:hypothetical protein